MNFLIFQKKQVNILVISEIISISFCRNGEKEMTEEKIDSVAVIEG
jgi:hypothetical protein